MFDDFDGQVQSDEREECGECGRPVGASVCIDCTEEQDGEPMGSHDLSDDADALASAGFGTDEDYGGYNASLDGWDHEYDDMFADNMEL